MQQVGSAVTGKRTEAKWGKMTSPRSLLNCVWFRVSVQWHLTSKYLQVSQNDGSDNVIGRDFDRSMAKYEGTSERGWRGIKTVSQTLSL